MADPLKTIIVKIFGAVVIAIAIVNFLKPLITIASENAVCANCDTGSSILFTTVIFIGAVGVAMYKLLGVFYGAPE